MRQMNDSADIDLRHFNEPVKRQFVKLPVGAKPCIVHQQIDDNVFFFGKRKNLLRPKWLRQIRNANERAYIVLVTELSTEACQPVAASRSQNQVRSASREF